MPAGVSWPVYLRFMGAALATGAVGSQVVHLIYRPLNDFPDLVAAEKERILKEWEDQKKQAEQNETGS